MDKYEFNPRSAFLRIRNHWQDWATSIGAKKWVVGISGGKDSTVVAAIATKTFGKENVYGVMMPNGIQTDIDDSLEVCRFLDIDYITINIEGAFKDITNQISSRICQSLSYDTNTNLPARLRMSTLYAVAQTIGGIVVNTCNASEDCIGFSTIYGDNAGSYAPIQGLTVTEIRRLGDWMGLPHDLIHKTPIDGLQPLSDEDKLGFTYEALDRYIREDVGSDEFKAHINELYLKNKFKTDIVRIPGPNFDDLGNFVRYNNLPDVRAKK
ncbi:MAG: NAD(+) synthase [Prevotella sp.]|nr:NAD(+) synthase [Prevotella sp.]